MYMTSIVQQESYWGIIFQRSLNFQLTAWTEIASNILFSFNFLHTAIKSVSEWTVEDVSDWLDELNLGEYKESFTDNAISGEHLTSLGKDDLSELGVKRLGHRLTIIKALQKLQNQ